MDSTNKMFNPKNAAFTNDQVNQTEEQEPVSQKETPNQEKSTYNEDDNYNDVAQTIEVGQKVSDYPIEKFSAIKGKVLRISVLSRKWKKVRTHFVKGIRRFYCFDGVCDQTKEGPPKIHYLIPLQVYETDVKGEIISKSVNIQFLALASKYYDSLSLIDSAQPLNTIDLKVICEDEQYQSNNYIPVPGKAMWLQDEEFKKAVVTEYKRLEPFILKAFARKLGRTLEESTRLYNELTNDATSFGYGNNYTGGTKATTTKPTENPAADDFDIDTYLQEQ
jgi:hypothetical protein